MEKLQGKGIFFEVKEVKEVKGVKEVEAPPPCPSLRGRGVEWRISCFHQVGNIIMDGKNQPFSKKISKMADFYFAV